MSEFKTMPLWAIEHEAMTMNCRAVIAQENQLKFDLDHEEAVQKFWHFYSTQLYARYGDKLPREHWHSRSGNDHWTIELPYALSVPERIALQTMGGSDPGREWAALCCHWDDSPHPVLLYRPLPKLLPASVGHHPFSEADVCWCQPFEGPVHQFCPMHGGLEVDTYADA